MSSSSTSLPDIGGPRCFGAHIDGAPGEPPQVKPPQREVLAAASRSSGGDDAS